MASRITMTKDLNAAIHHMIQVGNDYVATDDGELPEGLCIVNLHNGTAALMDTHGSCNMNDFTILEIL